MTILVLTAAVLGAVILRVIVARASDRHRLTMSTEWCAAHQREADE